jgi:hypothetical protein
VYRVTAADTPAVGAPCVLVVGFRLRGVRGFGHALFRADSVLNTPLFAGFPGFVSKLWLADDGNQLYRGVYDWDGVERAESYVSALYRVLALVSEPGSIRYRILPGLASCHWATCAASVNGHSGWWSKEGAELVGALGRAVVDGPAVGVTAGRPPQAAARSTTSAAASRAARRGLASRAVLGMPRIMEEASTGRAGPRDLARPGRLARGPSASARSGLPPPRAGAGPAVCCSV